MRNVQSYTILDDIGIKTAAFTAATTDIITSNAHGLKAGDMIVVSSTTTLPAGLAASTVYWVRDVATNTFKLSPTNNVDGNGPVVDITSTGTGTHTFVMHDIGKNIYVNDFRNMILSFDTDGGGDAAMTVKIVGSSEETCPDFSAAQSDTNIFDYIECINLNDGNSVAGDDGFVVATADDHVQYEVNVNSLKWINCIISGWTAGEVTVKAFLTDNQ